LRIRPRCIHEDEGRIIVICKYLTRVGNAVNYSRKDEITSVKLFIVDALEEAFSPFAQSRSD
jgi:hypothetical protein